MASQLAAVGLFAGIGGIELGFGAEGIETSFLCESWAPAQAVLTARFPGVEVASDVRQLRSLPKTDVVAAGFPCQDLSQAGRTSGIEGDQSSLVREVFRLLRRRHPTWLVLENVRFMLHLEKGRAMQHLTAELESLRYRWAYRVVDSRFTGVPQRRLRVILVASRIEDPRSVLFGDDAGDPPAERWRGDAYGFYWTEGLRGLGWAQDAVPTLKGGSTIGIPSPPGIWLPNEPPGGRLVSPSIEDGEALQGFPRGWTEPARTAIGFRKGHRWKLVGNAVTTGVARWLGSQLAAPRAYDTDLDQQLSIGTRWPDAAWGERGRVERVQVSRWPRHLPYLHLGDLLDREAVLPLSHRASSGFLDRLLRGGLKAGGEAFRLATAEHIDYLRGLGELGAA